MKKIKEKCKACGSHNTEILTLNGENDAVRCNDCGNLQNYL